MFGDTGNVMVVSAGGSPGPNESAGMTKLVDFSFVRVYERVALAVPAFAASACASWALVTSTSKTASRSARLFCSAVIKAWDKVIGRPSWAGTGWDSCANAAGCAATIASTASRHTFTASAFMGNLQISSAARTRPAALNWPIVENLSNCNWSAGFALSGGACRLGGDRYRQRARPGGVGVLQASLNPHSQTSE